MLLKDEPTRFVFCCDKAHGILRPPQKAMRVFAVRGGNGGASPRRLPPPRNRNTTRNGSFFVGGLVRKKFLGVLLFILGKAN